MNEMTIQTNNRARDILYWHELTSKEQQEFDYLDSEGRQQDASFFRYRGQTYDLAEFIRIEPPIAPHCQRPGWEKFDGYSSDSFFSGVLVKYVEDSERVIVATYFC